MLIFLIRLLFWESIRVVKSYSKFTFVTDVTYFTPSILECPGLLFRKNVV